MTARTKAGAGLVALLKPARAWNLVCMPKNQRQHLDLVKFCEY